MISAGRGWAAFRLRGERKTQEDVHRVLDPWGPDKGRLVFVADGHGQDGKQAAELVRKKLPGYLRRARFAAGTEHDAVRAACLKLDREIKLNYNGGTTLTLAYLSGRYSFLAWVGDSPGQLVTGKDILTLTRPHDFSREDEVARLRAARGFLLTRGGVPVRLVSGKDPGKAISLTRSLGDALYDSGWSTKIAPRELLIPEPEFADDQDLFAHAHWVLLSSDGMPRALEEGLVHPKALRFLCEEPAIPASEVAARFRKVLLRAHPADNVTSAFARPRAELIVSA